MGKTFAGNHKGSSSKQRNEKLVKFVNLETREKGINLNKSHKDERKNGAKTSSSFINGSNSKGFNKTSKNKSECNSLCNLDDNSYEVWCISRLVRPRGQRTETDRDITPTPGASGTSSSESGSDTATPKCEDNIEHNITDKCVTFTERGTTAKVSRFSVLEDRQCETDASISANFSRNTSAPLGREINDFTETATINLQELFSKLDELNSQDDGSIGSLKFKQDVSIADTPPGSPTASMDSASTCSFDHFDFDTSFCSLKSTDTMEPGDLADQLSLVQQMVMDMKTGFAHAMEELSKIQYGDQNLQQQLADSRKHCTDEITSMKQLLEQLKTEVQSLGGRLQQVCDTQRSLQEKLDTYQSDKDMLLEELERSGAIDEQVRLRLMGRENNNIIPPDVAPMVHPYLNSLQNHHKGPDDYNSDSSLTAAVSRSLNLTQALGEKCLNLDFSTASSDDEDNSRNSRSGSGHRGVNRGRSFQYEEANRHSQKVPPHEQVLGEVHREEAARDIVDVEREYCSQLWALMEDYMNLLRDSEIMSRREFHLLFPPYIPHIYEQHCILLRKMEERMKKWKSGGVIGDVFAKFTESQDNEGLMLYKDFINDFPTIINSMNKWFSHSPHFRELMQSQCLANAPVLPLLLSPLQQVPKYSILLKTLLKHTPVDHPDRYYLESSLTRLKQFLNSMNDDLEQAMQAINFNNQPVHRSRDITNSARSKSSASSGEANHVSRDSGVHSNEEERAKSPMSPNTTRRYLLQALREKREQGAHGHQQRADGQPSTPRSRKQPGYGSHPDLSNQPLSAQEGRMSPYLASLPQSKMFSSLSKLPLPRENSNSRRSRSHKVNRPVINPHYLRPLTPQVLPTSTSAHNFDSARRREEYAEKLSQRPASAMEFSYSSHDKKDEFLELLAQQASLAITPPHSTSSDRSRRELQVSLQKLLAETGNACDEYSDQDADAADGHVSYHKQFLTAKDRILRHDIQSEMYDDNVNGEHAQEDYGIYGDDDEDYDNDAEFDHDVKPMKLLQDSHRPKIMVPKWRQNASPQPPSYSHSVAHMNHSQTGSTSEETLAASLAQSLFDERQSTLQSSADNTADRVPSKGSLKRKGVVHRPESPVKSQVRQSPVPVNSNSLPRGKSLSFDGSSNRPNNLNVSSVNSSDKTSVPVSSTSGSDPSFTGRPNSVSKLTDIIAYTADCLERNDSQSRHTKSPLMDNSVTSGILNRDSPGITTVSKSEILDDENMQVSSVDTAVKSSVQNKKISVDGSQANSNFTFATSPVSKKNSDPKTDSVVYYFQNRDQINKGKTEENQDPSSRIPTFINMNKTSTPVKEQRTFVSSPTNDGSKPFSMKDGGRFVREDTQSGNASNDSEETTKTKGPNSVENKSESTDEPETGTKERVLMKVDKLRLSFERKKQISEERRQSRNELSSPTGISTQAKNEPSSADKTSIQKQFNDIRTESKAAEIKPLVLRTFSSPTNQVVVNNPVEPVEQSLSNGELAEPKQGLYKKAAKVSSDSAGSARHIQKMERATSPTARSPSPTAMNNPFDKFKTQVESSNLARPARRGTSPQRNSADVSLIPKRSKSPTRASMERERPKSTTDLGAAMAEGASNSSSQPLKSAMKDTKIPVLKKSGAALSKSSEDVSKIKKKSHFKDQLKNIFGRKKKKSKLYDYNGYDPDEEYNNHVTIATDASFQMTYDGPMFPLTKDRRANSTSQILQSYQFEDDSDDADGVVSPV